MVEGEVAVMEEEFEKVGGGERSWVLEGGEMFEVGEGECVEGWGWFAGEL